MVMKRSIAVIFLLSIISFVAFSLYVSVDVSGNIRADTNYINYTQSVNKQPIKILFNLENIGSVTCNSFYRVDFKQGNKTLYTAWSKKDVLKPGDIRLFDVYWNPTKPGKIKAYPKLYMCDDIYNLNEIDIDVTDILNESTNLIGIKYKNTNNSIKLYLKSNESKKVYIIPENYPQGWKFEPKEVSLEPGKEKAVSINFETPFFLETPVKFDIVSPDGGINDVKEIYLKEPKWYDKLNKYQIEFYIIVIIAILELIFIIFKKHKPVNRRRKKSRKR